MKCKNAQYELEAVHKHISAEKLSTHSKLVSLPGIYFTSKYAIIQCVSEKKKMEGKKQKQTWNHKMDWITHGTRISRLKKWNH